MATGITISAGQGGASGPGGGTSAAGPLIIPTFEEKGDLVTGAGPQSPLPVDPGSFGSAPSVTNFAMQRASAADDMVKALTTLAGSLVPPTIAPVFPQNTNAPAISAPLPPTLEPIVYTPPPVPSAFNGQLNADASFAAFDAEAPSLIFPAAPQQPQLDAPTSPAIDTNFTYPDVDVTLPDAPQLLTIATPRFNGVTFPTLSATAPVFNLIAPQIVNYAAGMPYTDIALMELQDSLRSRLLGGTGLAPAVEENLWNREREREARAQADAVYALDKMESMGYALPSGAWMDARIKVETETHYANTTSSRDIAIKQADLEQTNIKQAIDATVQLEGKLIDYANSREQRNFDATKYATEAGVSIYNAMVQAYQARVAAYAKAIDVYTAQMEGAKAEVAIYTSLVEAEKLKAAINDSLVQEYKVRVDAALASIEVFKGQISVIQTRAQIENLKVSIFGEQVRAYAAQANVYSTNVEAYKATIQAEGSKVQAYATQASAYGTLVDATAKEISARIETFKAQIAAKTEEYDAFRSLVTAEAERVRAVAAQNSAVADIYRAEVQGSSSYNEAMIKEWQAVLSLQEQVTQIGVSAAQANGQLYISARSIAADAAKVGAQVEAQMAASALGAVTWATHRSRQDSVGFSTSRGYSESRSQSQSSGTSTSVGVSTSTSFSSSVSGQASASEQTSKAE